MVAPVSSYIIVGEEGGHSRLTGDPAQSATGAENRMKAQNRRGYIARMVGDGRSGTVLELIQPLNNPEVSFEDVQKNFQERLKGGLGASNMLFRNRVSRS